MSGASYAYDGNGNRVKQTVGASVTQYLLDVQPGLSVVLSATTGANTERYVHGGRGAHAQQLNGGAWQHTLLDGLGSVRAVADAALAVVQSASYAPYGAADTPLTVTPFAFTGEMRDNNGLQYHRARYYAPGLGIFPSLDPLETNNRYSYVIGNPVNFLDPSGLTACSQPTGSPLDGLLCAMQECSSNPQLCASTALLFQWLPLALPLTLGGSTYLPPYPGLPAPQYDNYDDFMDYLSGALAIAAAEIAATAERVDVRERARRRNDCLRQCVTSSLAESYEPFRGAPGSNSFLPPSRANRTREYDLVCNLKCYNGIFEENIYGGFLLPAGTDFLIHDQERLDGTAGEFLPWRYDVIRVGLAGNAQLFSDVQGGFSEGLKLRSIGGMMIVWNSGGLRTRASAMATFVEEMWHAVHYQTLCGKITRRQTEIAAKAGMLAWIAVNTATGSIPFSAFVGVQELRESIEVLLNSYGGNMDALAFSGGDCPGSRFNPLNARLAGVYALNQHC
jgi:RHS repeat-associated protein